MTLYAGGWIGGPPEQNAPLVDDPWADVADLEPRHSPFAANIFVPPARHASPAAAPENQGRGKDHRPSSLDGPDGLPARRVPRGARG